MKSQPDIYLREPCTASREGGREASVAICVARDIGHRKAYRSGRRGPPNGRRQYVRHRYGERADMPVVSKTPWTHVSILPGPGRPSRCPALRAGPPKPRQCRAEDERREGVRCDDSSDEVGEQSAEDRVAELVESSVAPEGKSENPTHTGRSAGFRVLHLHLPDTEPGFCVSQGDGPITAGSWLADFLTSCARARPEGGAGCLSGHVLICAGTPGNSGAYCDRPVCLLLCYARVGFLQYMDEQPQSSQSPPAFLRFQARLVDHHQRRLPAAASLDLPRTFPYGRKRGPHWIRAPKVSSVLGRKLVEGQELLLILVQTGGRLLEGASEELRSGLGRAVCRYLLNLSIRDARMRIVFPPWGMN